MQNRELLAAFHHPYSLNIQAIAETNELTNGLLDAKPC